MKHLLWKCNMCIRSYLSYQLPCSSQPEPSHVRFLVIRNDVANPPGGVSNKLRAVTVHHLCVPRQRCISLIPGKFHPKDGRPLFELLSQVRVVDEEVRLAVLGLKLGIRATISRTHRTR